MTDVLDEDVKQALAILRSVNRVVGMTAKPLEDGEYTVELPSGKAVLLDIKRGDCIRADVLDKDEEPAPPAMLDKEGKPIEAGWYLDSMEGLNQSDFDAMDYPSRHPVLRVFEVVTAWWCCDRFGADRLSKDRAARLLRITSPFDCGFAR